MNQKDKIFIAGINGMVGSAIHRALDSDGYKNIIGKSSSELDLTDQAAVINFFSTEKPEYVFLAAAKVGGILANDMLKAEFIYNNLMIQSNLIHAAHKSEVKKLLFLGSSCAYPKNCPQPIKEEYLLTGELEQTNEPYAIAKIAGIKMCEAYRSQYGCNFVSVMPTNLYGPNDHYDLNHSHVLPSLIKKVHEAKKNQLSEVEIWGTGNPLREFLHVNDLANACLLIMKNYDHTGPINIGSGEEISITGLAQIIAEIVGFKGTFRFDTSIPEGTQRKLLDSLKINSLGWKPTISLYNGISLVYKDYLKDG